MDRPMLIAPLVPAPDRLADMALRIGLAVAFGFLLQRLLFVLVSRGESWIERIGQGRGHAQQRARTIGQIFRSLLTILVVGGVTVYALGVMGWDVRPLLATAGIAGVALGFGSQSLVRDVITGLFILAEDQFGVGDVIEVNGKPATVEALTVRSTTLRDFNGFLHFVPNGEMKVVVNRSRGWNRLTVDVPVAPDEDVDRALEACRRAAAAMSTESPWKDRLLDEIQVWGVESLGTQEHQVRLVVRAMPGPVAQEAARELRRRVHRALGDAGVRLSAQREIAITNAGPTIETVPGVRAS